MRYLILFLFLASCTVGTLPTPQPTPASSATPWPTNTPDPTPTLEVMGTPICNPKYAAELFTYAETYSDWQLLHKLPTILPAYTAVLLLETRGAAYRVVTRYGEQIEAWIPYYTLPVDCQPTE